jgi:MSHA biogenesis protein MshP
MNGRRKACGSALITAIFLIVVLLGLGIAMMKLSNVEHDTATKSLLSAKVYYGAKAGLDWGVQQAVAAGACAVSTGPFTLSGGSLSGVNVTVTCAEAKQGAASGRSVFYLTSKATIGTVGALSYAERRMEATVSNIP